MLVLGFDLSAAYVALDFPLARALARPEQFDHWGLVAIIALAFSILLFRLGSTVNRRSWRDRLLDQKREIRRRAREHKRPTRRRSDRIDGAARDAGSRSGALILVVEARAELRGLLHARLPSFYRTAEATGSPEALKAARLLSPELIIVDGTRFAADGIAWCRMIKSDRNLRHLPVILLGATVSEEVRVEAIHSGVDAVLLKPFSSDEFIALVDNLVESRRLLRERYSREVLLKPFDVVIPSSESAFIEKVHEIVNLRLEDERFTVGQLAREVGVSQTQLKRKLRALMDESPVELIRRTRLERAADLLKKRAGNVGDVAFATGFTNLSYFAKCFRSHWGVTPSQFLAGERSHRGDVPAS